MSILINILSTFNSKGLTAAEKRTAAFGKTVKGLGVTMAATFSARRITQFAKQSVKAFIEEDKAIRALSLNLQNLGLAYDTRPIEDYISQLQKATGVADQQLRPAFQMLANATQDIYESQRLLSLALDISAATGQSLTTVVRGLSRASTGTTTSLSRLNLGLTKAELTSKKFDEITEILSDRFQGQAAKAATTYAGKLAILQTSADEAQELLGKKLVLAVEQLMDPKKGIPALAESFENAADFVGDFAIGLAHLVKQAKEFNKVGNNPNFFTKMFQTKEMKLAFAIYRRIAKTGNEISMAEDKTRTNAIQHLKELNGIAVKYTKTQRTLTTELKNQDKLAKAKSILDLEKIQVEAALQGELTDNERLRLQLMKAVLNENADRATTLAEQLGKSQAELAKFKVESYNFKPESPFDAWLVAIEAMRKGLASIGGNVGTIPGAATPSGGMSNLSVTPSMPESSVFGGAAFITPELATRNPTGVTQINVTVQGTGGLDEQTKKAVVDAVVEASSYGTPTNWFRTTGSAVMPI
jgi:hypothetical protein